MAFRQQRVELAGNACVPDEAVDHGVVSVLTIEIARSDINVLPGPLRFWVATQFPDGNDPDSLPDVDRAPDEPQLGTWRVQIDVAAPQVEALRATCIAPCGAGAAVELPWQFLRFEHLTREQYWVYSSRRAAAIWTVSDGFTEKSASARRYVRDWPVPARPIGWHRFCVQVWDMPGNTSTRSCNKIVFPRINGDLTPPSGSRAAA